MTTEKTFKLIQEKHGHRLYLRNDGKFTVVRVDIKQGQVYSAIPGDYPQGSGTYYGRINDFGIAYVAGGYSESYARKIFNQLTNY